LDLASLEGVGRVRARILYKHGYHNLAELKPATADQLASIKTIGKSLAHSIVEQIHHPVAKKFSPKPKSFNNTDTEPVGEITEVWSD
jgi:replicative superfamily II helicase